MTTVEELVKRAKKLREQGQTDADIARDMNLSRETVGWLLTRDFKAQKPPSDVKIGWRTIGVSPFRTQSIAEILADVAVEELEKLEEQGGEEVGVECVVGVAMNGVSLASRVGELLDADFSVFRPGTDSERHSGHFASNCASVGGKNVIIIDDVLGTGTTMRSAIKAVKDEGGNPVLSMVLVNKTKHDVVDDIPVRALIRARVVQ